MSLLVLMGVSGCGKTSVGEMLAECLGWRFLEGDDLHPAANIEKMRAGIPLSDADRAPWLRAVAARMETWRAQEADGVVACSALKRAYRDIVIAGAADTRLVYLRGTPELIAGRLAGRQHRYMPPTLLASQFAALEEPGPEERAIVVDVAPPLAAVVSTIMARLAEEEAT
jgi:carbohydrate kinase (thermoresistant glucokinase family)